MTIRPSSLISSAYACLAIVLVVWQHIGMEHVLELVPSPAAGIYQASDANEGGLSESHITVVDGLVTLDCRTQLSDVFAYCGFKMPLTSKGQNVGLDFSRYSTVEFTLSFQSSVRDTVFLYLLNEETLRG